LAMVHCGWRGLAGGIVAGAAGAVDAEAAAIGPGIGPCCYEVGNEVLEPFRERFGAGVLRGDRLDLWTSAERALTDAGVADVHRTDLCTACNAELFFSHRRDAGRTGRQGMIALVT
jgi:copper oxidase (laccase) domain-containing protein